MLLLLSITGGFTAFLWRNVPSSGLLFHPFPFYLWPLWLVQIHQPFFDCAVTLDKHIPNNPGEGRRGKFWKTLSKPSELMLPRIIPVICYSSVRFLDCLQTILIQLLFYILFSENPGEPSRSSRHPRKNQTWRTGECAGPAVVLSAEIPPLPVGLSSLPFITRGLGPGNKFFYF